MANKRESPLLAPPVSLRGDEPVFVRRGARYRRVGYGWTGFFSDGLWLVTNGRANQRHLLWPDATLPAVTIGSVETLRDDVQRALALRLDAFREGDPVSSEELADLVLTIVAKHATLKTPTEA
jgi:hypothetical protein